METVINLFHHKCLVNLLYHISLITIIPLGYHYSLPEIDTHSVVLLFKATLLFLYELLTAYEIYW